MQDERAMREALKLARKGLGNTSPNPMVGALVVAGDEVVGRGYHDHAGSDHAEVVALRDAGSRARGATLFVTLEPCAHHGRTPPCVDAIIAAAPARVVVALEDPDEQVRGKGIAALLAAGVQVDVGVERQAAEQVNRMYLHQRRSGRPFVTLKMAQSLDGKIAAQPGERLQLSGTSAQRFVRGLRYEHDAVMVGAGTIIVDDPQLTVRPYKKRHVLYTRVVVDAHGKVSPRARVFRDQNRARTVVLTTANMPAPVRAELEHRTIKVLQCEADHNGMVDMHDGLRQLGDMEIISVLCEGGPTLAASLLQQRLVHELQWLIAPLLLGGEAVSVVGDGMMQAPITVDSLRRLGQDLAVTAHLTGP